RTARSSKYAEPDPLRWRLNSPVSALAATVVQQSACHALGSATLVAHSFARMRVSPFARVVRNLNEYQRAAGCTTPVAGPFEQVSAGSLRVRSDQARLASWPS